IVFERTKGADLLHSPEAVEGVEEMRVARGQLGRFQVATAQVRILEGARILRLEKVEAEPAAIGARNALRLAKEGDEQEQNEISIDPRLELEIAREILRGDPAIAAPDLDCGVQGVVDFLHERAEGADIMVR